MKKEVKTYEGLLEQSKLVSKIITPEMANAVFTCNDFTVSNLAPIWKKNLKKNLTLYKKHGSLFESFRGFGNDKAVIGIGAGPSFNRNKDYLKKIYDYNLQFKLEDQPFIFVAANKQLKPLLKMGIHPHFTLLIDAGDALYPQLCEGIPKNARDSILITGLHTSNKILKQWDKNGGNICFFLIGQEEEQEYFKEQTGEDPELLHIQQGGNVLNTLWVLCHRVFGSKVYFLVGSDLAFELTDDRKKREKSFYADGDYSFNVANRRDEAKDNLGWMGFEFVESTLYLPSGTRQHVNFNMTTMATSRQLWVYKTWLEVQATIWSDKLKFVVYNCSESGVLGVLAKNLDRKSLYERDNWYLIDEVIPTRWRTRTLRQATTQFLKAKILCQTPTVIKTDVSGADAWLGKTVTASDIGRYAIA